MLMFLVKPLSHIDTCSYPPSPKHNMLMNMKSGKESGYKACVCAQMIRAASLLDVLISFSICLY